MLPSGPYSGKLPFRFILARGSAEWRISLHSERWEFSTAPTKRAPGPGLNFPSYYVADEGEFIHFAFPISEGGP